MPNVLFGWHEEREKESGEREYVQDKKVVSDGIFLDNAKPERYAENVRWTAVNQPVGAALVQRTTRCLGSGILDVYVARDDERNIVRKALSYDVCLAGSSPKPIEDIRITRSSYIKLANKVGRLSARYDVCGSLVGGADGGGGG
ncbi:hypothetical protein LSH36_211g04059 [Paralvinella palmiformis]|uniref:Uncharacterized protein n=1 Tax=Paralvinella palmiformis TaxID=53620 RepID=A0AAD9JPG8_9ANNE|nr:hypothetical protein LSH36_211g04059 [Paralvinella palmiformis]